MVAKLASGLFTSCSLLRNNNMAANLLFKGSLQFTVVGVLPRVTVQHRHLDR